MINRMNDRFFKAMFGDEKHKERVIALINAFFEFEGTKLIKDIKIKDREIDPEYQDRKLSILDIMAIAEDGTKLNIELQALYHKSFIHRVLYYWSKLYAGTLKKGEKYSSLNRTVSINIMNFEVFPYEEYHGMYGLMNSKNQYKLTEQMEMHFVEVPKWKAKSIKEMKRLDKWMAYLSNKVEEREMEEIAMSEPMIQEVLEAEKIFMENPELRSEYEYREEELRTYRTDMEDSRREGIKLGIEKGILQTAKKMLKRGLSIEMVAEITALPIAQLRKMAKESGCQ